MKFPIGIQSFEKLREGGYGYVAKTALVYKMVSEGSDSFLSRPRRFGKSLLTSTLKAYFQGRRDLFKGLAIENIETEWCEYPIFHLDFNGLNFTMPGTLENAIEDFIAGAENTARTSLQPRSATALGQLLKPPSKSAAAAASF